MGRGGGGIVGAKLSMRVGGGDLTSTACICMGLKISNSAAAIQILFDRVRYTNCRVSSHCMETQILAKQ
jgi:hypothetical protein